MSFLLPKSQLFLSGIGRLARGDLGAETHEEMTKARSGRKMRSIGGIRTGSINQFITEDLDSILEFIFRDLNRKE